jgi:hypothetical protein
LLLEAEPRLAWFNSDSPGGAYDTNLRFPQEPVPDTGKGGMS